MGAQTALSQLAFRPATIAQPAAVPLPRPRVTSCVLLASDLIAIFAARVLAMTIWHWFHPAAGFPNFLGFWELLGLFVLTYAALGFTPEEGSMQWKNCGARCSGSTLCACP
jgi:hypothetical protein